MKLFVFFVSFGLLMKFSSGFLPQNKQTQRKFTIILNELVRSRSIDTSYYLNSIQNTVQKPKNQKEFCNINGAGRRSSVRPSSVHKLRAGDIDVIGAMGDSLTSANGAFATHLLQSITEDRAVSWSGGGNSNWQIFLTLPNLLKVYNPHLIGYSSSASGNSYSFEDAAQFNVAEPGSLVDDAVRQAKMLVKRMRSDRRVDIRNDWKLITIMTGSNDFCMDICAKANSSVSSIASIVGRAQQNLITALRILKKNLPRTLINLVIPVDPIVTLSFTNLPLECQLVHGRACPCYAGAQYKNHLKRTDATARRFKEMVKQVAHMPEFHTNDFEVNLMKFTTNINLNHQPNGKTDYTLLSKDCFHVSQKGHHFFAMNLWNAMLTPERERSEHAEFYGMRLKCPTYQSPYFKTSGN